MQERCVQSASVATERKSEGEGECPGGGMGKGTTSRPLEVFLGQAKCLGTISREGENPATHEVVTLASDCYPGALF